MELSKRLKEVLSMMNNDWELSIIDGFPWSLQLGGSGKGGETKRLHGKLRINKLINLHFIEACGMSFPTTKYRLTEKGKAYLK